MNGKQHILPRWRGFNLQDFYTSKNGGAANPDDFLWIRDWGFDFVRLPMSYTLWTEPGDVYAVREEVLASIDRAVELGRKHGIHVCLNFHRAPGYCVNPPKEPLDLWKEPAALDAFCFHWQLFARRYRGIPSAQLSFDLVNEPPAPTPDGMTRAGHERVIRAAVAAIRDIDPDRLIIADGLAWGNDPIPELCDLRIAQSCRAYIPMGISHYRAPWVDGEKFPEPVWPGGWHYGTTWDRAALESHYARWAALAAGGIGVHCGEGGSFIHTPHAVFLRWFRDVLEILAGHHIGFSLWEFRGSFGILDSRRADIAYADWHGHQLDRELLDLLQQH